MTNFKRPGHFVPGAFFLSKKIILRNNNISYNVVIKNELYFDKEEIMPVASVLTASVASIGLKADGSEIFPVLCLYYPFGIFLTLDELLPNTKGPITILPDHVVVNIANPAVGKKSIIQAAAFCYDSGDIVIFKGQSDDLDKNKLNDFQILAREKQKFYFMILSPTPAELSRPIGKLLFRQYSVICSLKCDNLFFNNPEFDEFLSSLNASDSDVANTLRLRKLLTNN